ncbi:MAG: anti-sigma factor family protein [Planctomycetaceae bacterium]
MPHENPQSPSFTEKLVAYLDGELPEDDAREVEQSFASDPAIRAEVEQLNRAWDMLDLLPRPNASDEFSRRTLASLKVSDATTALPDSVPDELSAAPTVSLAAARPSRFRVFPLVAWSAGLIAVSLLGFFGGRMTARPDSEVWLDDLALIEQLEVYREIGDVQFLRDFQDLPRERDRDDHRPPR